MEIILIRHGESIGNALKGDNAVYTGRWDCDLTDTGYQQAKALRSDAMLENVDRYYCSPLKRAIQTAKAFTDHELIIDKRIMERSLGDFEGKRVNDIKANPKYSKYFTDLFYMKFRTDFVAKAPHGESYGDVCVRIRPFIQEILTLDCHRIVVISHFVIIKCILKELLHLSEEETLSLKVKNCKPIVVHVPNE